jgi:4-hydroxybenzoate polyprenyltransferase
MAKGILSHVSGVHNLSHGPPAMGQSTMTIWILFLILWRSSTKDAVNAFTPNVKQCSILISKPKLGNQENLRKETKLLENLLTDKEGMSFSEDLSKGLSNCTVQQEELLGNEDRLDLNDFPKLDWNNKLHNHCFMWQNVSAQSLSLPYKLEGKNKDINQQSILMSLPTLWLMCRPNNFIGIVLFHILGTYLAINKSNTDLLKTLLHPQQIAVLFAILLTSATSMLVNDYYDLRSGVDSHKVGTPKASPRVMKRVLGLLYAPLLLMTAVVPGISARLIVLSSAMLTFLYTEHLKPLTWVKTITCAFVIAMSPLTSGLAALSLDISESRYTSRNLGIMNSLFRLVSLLFCGFFGREILMDMNDIPQDQRHGIQTVPVRYGVQYSTHVVLLATLLMSFICLQGTKSRLQLILGFTGCILQIIRSLQVFWSNGKSSDDINTAVEEGKLTMLLILASFI